MNQISKEDVNKDNIVEVLEKVGFEFEESAVLPNELSDFYGVERADFVVRLDDVFYTVDVIDFPVDDRFARRLSFESDGLSNSIGLEHFHRSRIVLSTFDDENKIIEKDRGSLHMKIPVYSLNGILLD